MSGRRPSFQFYPADWKSNANLRRCSPAARGAWMDILCLLHDEDEYGIARWPLSEVASAAGVRLCVATELVKKSVLKGSEGTFDGFWHTPFHAGKAGDKILLIPSCSGPIWFSSRMVTDEWRRSVKGASTRFTAATLPLTMPRQGDELGDGSSSSTPYPKKEEDITTTRTTAPRANGKKISNGHGGNGNGRFALGSVTVKDPSDRLNRFQIALASQLGPQGWPIISAASNLDDPQQPAAWETCRLTAIAMGKKGLPPQWKPQHLGKSSSVRRTQKTF